MKVLLLVCGVVLAIATSLLDGHLLGGILVSPVYADLIDNKQAPPNFRDLVKQAGVAVVTIKVSRKSVFTYPNASLRDSPHQDDELADLFRRILPPEGRRRDNLQTAFGCGFIVSADGLVLTDSHLLDNSSEIWVSLRDGRSFKAVILGTDALTDVALLKIDATTDLPVVTIGDPNRLEVGDWVLAIGSPFGFDHSVTQGIVSATGRALPDEYYVPFIQTDVSINPGNSGGHYSIWREKWSPSIHRSTLVAVVTWDCPSRYRSTSRWELRINS